LGAIEDALKTEIDETTVLQKLAFKLAREIDLDSGGIAAFRELRTLLTVIKQDRSYRSPAEREERRRERKREAKWAQMPEGEWEWSEAADDWVQLPHGGSGTDA
jgi:hypothetical protein